MDNSPQYLEDILSILRSSRFTHKVERVAVLDAFLQFCENPTSATAGFGIDENYYFISRNLQSRYNLSNKSIEDIVNFLRAAISDLFHINSDVYFWRKKIAGFIKTRFLNEILEWYESFYEELNNDDKLKFIFLLNALAIIGKEKDMILPSSLEDIFKWYRCFFDKDEIMYFSDFINLLVKFGFGSILFYRSSRGHEDTEFRPFTFLRILIKKFEDRNPVSKQNVEEFFNSLTLDNIKFIEVALTYPYPVVDIKVSGQITQRSPLIIETSRSYWAISPFSIKYFHELIYTKKMKLFKPWREKIETLLNSIVKMLHPFAELKHLQKIDDSAEIWQIVYTESFERSPITILVFFAPYLFPLSSVKTVANEIFIIPSHLRLIFLLEETIPKIQEEFKHFSGENLIFLFEKSENAFYLFEKSTKMLEEHEFQIRSFLSKFIPLLREKYEIKEISKELKNEIEVLEYFNKYPNLVMLKIKIPEIELKLRNHIRVKLKEMFGEHWQKQIENKSEGWRNRVRKLEEIAKKRVEKFEKWDFLDGATLGDLVQIMDAFLKPDEVEKSLLRLILKYRSIIEHPIKEFNEDIDQRVYKQLTHALEYLSDILAEKQPK